MSAQRLSPDDYREWLNRARSSLARAKHRIPEVYLEDLCFDAQQAAEKAIKALLIRLGVHFPRLHDLNELLSLVEKGGGTVPDYVKKAAALTEYAVESRYPGMAEPVIEEEYLDVVAIAEGVVGWVEKVLEGMRQHD